LLLYFIPDLPKKGFVYANISIFALKGHHNQAQGIALWKMIIFDVPFALQGLNTNLACRNLLHNCTFTLFLALNTEKI
jgi:hypothetical protein